MARAVLATTEAKVLADVVATQAEVAKESEEEFEADFFQGYSNLKRLVALLHLEWDLFIFSGAESDYWEVETPVGAKEGEGTRTPPAEGVGENRGTDATTE